MFMFEKGFARKKYFSAFFVIFAQLCFRSIRRIHKGALFQLHHCDATISLAKATDAKALYAAIPLQIRPK